MWSPLKFENDVRRKALIDTGACANAMPADIYEKIKTHCPNSRITTSKLLNVKVGTERTVKVLAQLDVKFKIIAHQFGDVLLILPSMNSLVLCNPFFNKYNTEISPEENLLKLPNMTYQINEIKIHGRLKFPKTKYSVGLH